MSSVRSAAVLFRTSIHSLHHRHKVLESFYLLLESQILVQKTWYVVRVFLFAFRFDAHKGVHGCGMKVHRNQTALVTSHDLVLAEHLMRKRRPKPSIVASLEGQDLRRVVHVGDPHDFLRRNGVRVLTSPILLFLDPRALRHRLLPLHWTHLFSLSLSLSLSLSRASSSRLPFGFGGKGAFAKRRYFLHREEADCQRTSSMLDKSSRVDDSGGRPQCAAPGQKRRGKPTPFVGQRHPQSS